ISGNLYGLSIQNACSQNAVGGPMSCVQVHSGDLHDNVGVGIDVSGSSRGVIFCRTLVKGTKATVLPTEDGSSASVGYGVQWRDGSEVTLEETTLDSNALRSLLIDGPVSGAIKSLTLAGGDDAMGKAPIQQGLMMGDTPVTNTIATDPMHTLPIAK